MSKCSFFYVLVLGFSLFFSHVYAKETRNGSSLDSLGIAAVVNDQIITVSDLNNRINLVRVSSNLPDSKEARDQLRPQVLKSLIDEALQLQEAHKNAVIIADEEVEEALKTLEKQNKMEPGNLVKLLEQNKVSVATLRDQIRANISWVRLITDMNAANIVVSEKEMQDVVRAIESAASKPQLKMAEIFLSVDTMEKEAEVLRNAMKLVADVRRGANFDMLARQFSESPTAAKGGLLGWVHEEQMPIALRQSLSNLKVGDVSDPIRTKTGVYILKLHDKGFPTKEQQEAALAPEPEPIPQKSMPATLDLKQVVISLFLDRSEEALDRAAEQIEKIRDKAKSCDNLDALATEVDAHVEELEGANPAALPEHLQGLIALLPEKQPSRVFKGSDAVGFLMICKKHAAVTPKPQPQRVHQPVSQEAPVRQGPLSDEEKEQIRQKIVSQKLEQIAQRVLRNLRRTAFIETRI